MAGLFFWSDNRMWIYPRKIVGDLSQGVGIERDPDVAMTPDQAAAMIVTMPDDEAMVWSHVRSTSVRDNTQIGT